jgi:hypothetical protein
MLVACSTAEVPEEGKAENEEATRVVSHEARPGFGGARAQAEAPAVVTSDEDAGLLQTFWALLR